MPDREKVIRGLESHADGCGYRSHHCDSMECPYRYGDESCDIEEMCRDALALLKEQEDLGTELTNAMELIHKKNERIEKLLKEQEAVEPKKENDGNPEPWTVWWYVCGDCGQPIDKMDRYCRRCGKQVKWE